MYGYAYFYQEVFTDRACLLKDLGRSSMIHLHIAYIAMQKEYDCLIHRVNIDL